MKRQPVGLLLASVLAISSAHAADTVRWEDLPKKLGERRTCEYTIVTKDGKAQRASDLTFIVEGVTFSGASAVIPRELVAEIRIHHHVPLDDASAVPAEALFSGMGAGWIIWLTPIALITYALTAPPAMAVEGIRRLLPDKVIKVAP